MKHAAIRDENYKEDALWPEHHQRDKQKSIPHCSRDVDLRRGRATKDASNPLVKFYNEPEIHQTSKQKVTINQIDNNKKSSSNGGFTPNEVVRAVTSKDTRKFRETSHLTTTAKEMRQTLRRSKNANNLSKASIAAAATKNNDTWRPGKWTTDMPKYGSYDRIMQKRPNSAGAYRNQQQYSDGSYPQKFVNKEKPKQRPRSASEERRRSRSNNNSSNNNSNNTTTTNNNKSNNRPKSANSALRIQPSGRYLAISSPSPIKKKSSHHHHHHPHKYPHGRASSAKSYRRKHHRDVTAIDEYTGAQVGINRAPPPRSGTHRLGDEWFGDEKIPLRHCHQSQSFPAKYNREKRDRKNNTTFGTVKQVRECMYIMYIFFKTNMTVFSRGASSLGLASTASMPVAHLSTTNRAGLSEAVREEPRDCCMPQGEEEEDGVTSKTHS